MQHSPNYLNLPRSISKAVTLCREAANQHADLIVFPETWLPGYPVWLDYAPEAGLWDHPPAKALYRLLTENAVQIEDPHFNKLSETASDLEIVIVMGAHEKVGRTLYNTLFYFLPDGSHQLHRKLMPTYTERLIWGQGDGSTLPVVEHHKANIGGLICWEHWMPLARSAMHHLGEDIHIAQWPAVKELHQVASRHYAFEGQCYVIAAGTTISKKQMLNGLSSVIQTKEDEAALELINSIPTEPKEYILKGGSAVIKPNGEYLTEAVYDAEEIIYSHLDMQLLSEGNLFLDTDGHYSRPDVFNLSVNTQAQTNVTFGPTNHED
ncbi:MAG: carbon-nitrogen hydrolase family protein [Balneolaceae bacterium]|nr:carbon-nitrogen hydrolase family protein [Balneolaceae bacterium]